MKRFIINILLLFPTLTFGQNFAGNYRATFFNVFSEPKMIAAEFEVKSDNSIVGKVKVGDEIKNLNGVVDKKGKFEAVSPAEGNAVYKLKGKFDKNNKVSFIQRVQIGSGLNKSVSENSLEGTFSKVVNVEAKIDTPKSAPTVELIDNGKSWVKIEHLNPIFGNEWLDFSAKIIFNSSVKGMANVNRDSADYFDLVLKSKTEGQQRLSIATRNYSPTQKLWKANDLRYISYREESGATRNSFMAGEVMQTDSFYSEGRLEIVKETDSQIVFKLSNFKIKRFAKQDFVVLNGYIYVDK